jgi:hypothetical protein
MRILILGQRQKKKLTEAINHESSDDPTYYFKEFIPKWNDYQSKNFLKQNLTLLMEF